MFECFKPRVGLSRLSYGFGFMLLDIRICLGFRDSDFEFVSSLNEKESRAQIKNA